MYDVTLVTPPRYSSRFSDKPVALSGADKVKFKVEQALFPGQSKVTEVTEVAMTTFKVEA
jgi:hypothetical protein